jgi:uncharacterized NAD-dependent epimerase/dehydratase family protein
MRDVQFRPDVPWSTPIPQPYLVFLGDIIESAYAKTAFGLRDWAADRCLGEYALPTATVSVGLPPLTPEQASAHGARAMVIGVASPGGTLPDTWVAALLEAMNAGLHLVGGLHARLGSHPELKAAAGRLQRRLIDVREPPRDIPVGTGRKRSGRRLLTVGTDCGLGKKYTALALTRAAQEQGIDAEFRATGQTGILIAGSGIPIDAMVADFVAGAAEMLSPDAPETHWDIVEGQGSVFHPSYAGVSLGLLHGTQPDVIVLCHEVGREHMKGLSGYATPSLEEAIELHIRLARRTNPRVRCGGVSLNTSRLTAAQAAATLSEHSARLQLPVADPIRGGPQFASLVAACLDPK